MPGSLDGEPQQHWAQRFVQADAASRLGVILTLGISRRLVRASMKNDKSEYEVLFEALRYAVHELPIGVLWDANGADGAQCEELMKDLNRFEELSKARGSGNSVFVAGCRWHFERYPHYLSRHRHFGSCPKYIEKYKGPVSVLRPDA